MPEAPDQPDNLELDLRRYELRRGSRVLKLEKNPMELLILLVERRDQLVGREEIIRRLWGKDVFLDTEQGVNTAIRKIRLILGDDPNEPRFLQTVVGKGYRFVGPIAVIAAEPTLSRSSAPATSPASAAEDDKSQLNRTESAPVESERGSCCLDFVRRVNHRIQVPGPGSLAAACTGACDCSVAT